MEDDYFTGGFIKRCNRIDLYGVFDEEPIQETIQELLRHFFEINSGNTFLDITNKPMFEAITQKNVLKVIEKGILELFEKNMYVYDYDAYIFNCIYLSGLKFLVDYAESHEDVDSGVKKRLQIILNHKNTINMTENIYEYIRKRIHLVDDSVKNLHIIEFKHMPLSHDWWKRD